MLASVRDAAQLGRVVGATDAEVAVDRHEHRQVDGARLGGKGRREEVLAHIGEDGLLQPGERLTLAAQSVVANKFQ